MSKVLPSPSKRWSGSVTISDPMYLPQAEAVDLALSSPPEFENQSRISYTAIDKWHWQAIAACVEKWDIEGYPKGGLLDPIAFENIPLNPRKESHDFLDWLFGEIEKVYLGELEIPNE